MSGWRTVPGVMTKGHGVASGEAPDSPYPQGSIRMQKPFFAARGLDLGAFHEGTLNIDIAPHTFALTAPEYTFRNIAWTDRHPPEDFSFSRCAILYGGIRYDGWVYHPHVATKRAHFTAPTVIEVITRRIPGVALGDSVELMVKTDEIELR